VDDGGLQQQPELGDAVDAPTREQVTDDLSLLDDDDDMPLPLPTQLDKRLQRAAQFAFLDPDDGISL